MNELIARTFGGLSPSYYFRQLFFSLIMGSLAMLAAFHDGHTQYIVIGFTIVSTFLYPYSRFVYESIVGFIMGENTFFFHISIFLFFKAFTMVGCWIFAILIAPIGLLYLNFHHRRNQRGLEG